MGRKKEIIIITIIVAITIILAIIPTFSCSNKKEDVVINTNTSSETNTNSLSITLEGELNVPIKTDISRGSYTNTITLELKRGISYREISDIVYSQYRTKYTEIDTTLYQTRYYSDTTIVFSSCYKEEIITTETIDIITTTVTEDLICINTASKDILKTLYGIGEARATLIIEYRSNNYIDTFDELKSLIGVSDEVIEHIKTEAIL